MKTAFLSEFNGQIWLKKEIAPWDCQGTGTGLAILAEKQGLQIKIVANSKLNRN